MPLGVFCRARFASGVPCSRLGLPLTSQEPRASMQRELECAKANKEKLVLYLTLSCSNNCNWAGAFSRFTPRGCQFSQAFLPLLQCAKDNVLAI